MNILTSIFIFKANGGKKLPIILWTSTLTEYQHIDEYLSNEDYIIQVRTYLKVIKIKYD